MKNLPFFGCLSLSVAPMTIAWIGCLLVALFTSRKPGEPMKTSERWLLVLSVLLIMMWGALVIAMMNGMKIETR